MSDLHIGQNKVVRESQEIEGQYVFLNGEEYYQISNYDQMKPFFMTIVSHSDHWMFLTSDGGITAGRKNSNSALFPYYTDDKLSVFAEGNGSKTIIKATIKGKKYLWEPFSFLYSGVYKVRRNLLKHTSGNTIIFEEYNEDLELVFKYKWEFSEKYGFIKSSEVLNMGDTCEVEILDGLLNIIPFGVGSDVQRLSSNLVNAYKKNELVPESDIGLFLLSSMIVDRAEPSEALKATTCWTTLEDYNKILLSRDQIPDYRSGAEISTETDVKARSGAYMIEANFMLEKDERKHWKIVADVNQDYKTVIEISEGIKSGRAALDADIDADVKKGRSALINLVAMADGLQLTDDKLSINRHFSNVLFNIMRGGIFDNHYTVERADFIDYCETINTTVSNRNKEILEKLPESIDYRKLLSMSIESGDIDLIRLSYEYLPLIFSRRHGDPSRPWNAFSIETKKQDGSLNRTYQGNWRDIFQNWEALALSFPDYLPSMISKFLNASTLDGYNPYRITREGIDWELIEPDNPWSYIGYWGDHQIIYLLKFLEILRDHYPDQLNGLLDKTYFVYANVPYRIKGYDDIVKDPQDTIMFDDDLEHTIEKRVATTGGDGKLVVNSKGELLRANMTEKLLVTLLAKLSNFIPEAGIWLNTQRPEWNDANNALVGSGVSMVTLYYMRRFVKFMHELYASSDADQYTLNASVTELFKGIDDCFKSHKSLLDADISNKDRKLFVDQLGKIGEQYRAKAYQIFDGTTSDVAKDELLRFFELTMEYLDHSIYSNRRNDGLYHAYNLIEFKDDDLTIDRLYEMLEGQVAVLSSGLLSTQESLDVLNALKQSDVYREDQYSYLLYPERELPLFLAKNIVPEDFVKGSSLAQKMLGAGDYSILTQDKNKKYHFSGSFHNANDLEAALESARERYGALVDAEFDDYLAIFESIFNHKAFTGRSGTFYGYEGLGSIYWHMVSKLLLAVQESIYREEDPKHSAIGSMIDHYYEIRAGIGINKTPDLYGAIPTDPYSHTPATKGAQQPGMTGQVKEDVINRWSELGVRVYDSSIHFEPRFLHEKEFLKEEMTFDYLEFDGSEKSIAVQPNQLAFTYCQVPVIYQAGSKNSITITRSDGSEETIEGNILTREYSSSIFSRDGSVTQLLVELTL